MDNNFTNAVYEIFEKIARNNQELEFDKEISIYLAGGAAVHFYVNARVSDDVDAIMEPYSPSIPEDLEVIWNTEEGEPKALSFDYQYNPCYGLLHYDYQERAHKLKEIGKNIVLYVLHPIDLVVTKLSRYSPSDEKDIEALVQLKSFEIEKFKELANTMIKEAAGVSPTTYRHIAWVEELYEENHK